jgi:hypothetical protein
MALRDGFPGGNQEAGKKYELVRDESIKVLGRTLYRIRALKTFRVVGVGELGGYVESERNLSQTGTCWVFGNAKVSGSARIQGNALISLEAHVFGNAQVNGNARVGGHAQVFDNACIGDNTWVSGKAKVFGDAQVCDYAQVTCIAEVSGMNRVDGDEEVAGNIVPPGESSGGLYEVVESLLGMVTVFSGCVSAYGMVMLTVLGCQDGNCWEGIRALPMLAVTAAGAGALHLHHSFEISSRRQYALHMSDAEIAASRFSPRHSPPAPG